MLGWGEKKLRIAAPMKGRLMDIAAVPDPVLPILQTKGNLNEGERLREPADLSGVRTQVSI